MAYRRTDRVTARLAARHEAILAAARALASESGLAAVQIVPVAERAGIAAGTVYRYFPSKDNLISALVAASADRAVAAIRKAVETAPGPLSGLAAAIMTFATGLARTRRLAWAILAEAPDSGSAEAVRVAFRRCLAAEFEVLIRAAVTAGHLPEQDPAAAAAALIGAASEVLAGPLAISPAGPDAERVAVQALALFLLRALGIVDARARGLVVQAGVKDQPEL
jgi:AcrR family transcriptional regulator